MPSNTHTHQVQTDNRGPFGASFQPYLLIVPCQWHPFCLFMREKQKVTFRELLLDTHTPQRLQFTHQSTSKTPVWSATVHLHLDLWQTLVSKVAYSVLKVNLVLSIYLTVRVQYSVIFKVMKKVLNKGIGGFIPYTYSTAVLCKLL